MARQETQANRAVQEQQNSHSAQAMTPRTFPDAVRKASADPPARSSLQHRKPGFEGFPETEEIRPCLFKQRPDAHTNLPATGSGLLRRKGFEITVMFRQFYSKVLMSLVAFSCGCGQCLWCLSSADFWAQEKLILLRSIIQAIEVVVEVAVEAVAVEAVAV